MELPDPNSYPRLGSVEYPIGLAMQLCAHCLRDELKIEGNVDKHIMGCAFRSRYYAIAHFNYEQERQAAIDKIEAILKKMDGDELSR